MWSAAPAARAREIGSISSRHHRRPHDVLFPAATAAPTSPYVGRPNGLPPRAHQHCHALQAPEAQREYALTPGRRATTSFHPVLCNRGVLARRDAAMPLHERADTKAGDYVDLLAA